MIKKCSGCGIVLQDTDSNKEGYVADLNKGLCERCFRLRNYGVYKYTSRDNSSYEKILDKSIDYVVDAIDTVTAKIALVENCKELEIPIISSMGTGNKLDPTKLEISDISKTSVCPLAKVMRKELKERGIKKLKVLYTKEEPVRIEKSVMEEYIKDENVSKKQIPGSVSFVPSCAGLIIAGEVIKDIIKK